MKTLGKIRDISRAPIARLNAEQFIRRRALAVFFALTALGPAQAASPWRIWTKADGLRESVAFGLTSDHAGRIIIKGGDIPSINVLDGYQITEIPNPRGYGRMLASSTEELWTFDAKGIVVHDSTGWHTYPDSEIAEYARTSPMSRISWFMYSAFRGSEDRLDVVPFGKDSGVIMFPDRLVEWNRASGQKRVLKLASQTLLTQFRDIQSSRDGGLWLTGATGLAQLRRAGGDYEWREFSAPERHRELMGPIEGDDGELFVTTMRSDGKRAVVRFFRGSWEETYVADTPRLKGWRGPEGRIWIQKERKIIQLDEGVHAGDQGTDRSITGLVTGVITQPDRSFWLGTTEGVARYSPPLWRTPSGIAWADGAVSAITGDAQGRVWFLSGSFLIVNDHRTWKRFRLPSGDREALLTDNVIALENGDLVIRGNSSADLIVFSPRSGKFRLVTHPEERRIGWIEKRPSGAVWVQVFQKSGRRWDLDVFDGSRFMPGGFPPMADLRDIKAILSARNGDIWLAATNALGLLRNGKLRIVGTQDGFTDSGVFSMVESEGGRIVFGGRDHVTEYDGKSFRRMRDIDVAESICTDRNGILWAASGSGIHRYRPGQWITNTVDDGLPATAVRKVYADSQGRIWAGTSQGIALYYPNADTDPPLTRIIDDRNLRETPPGGKVRLAFSGADKWKFTAPERLLFSWRMDNSGWSDFVPAQFASFDGLPAGAHRFQVRSMDRNGNIDPTPPMYEFSVLLPWYQQNDFLILACLAVIAITGLSRLAWLHHAKLKFQGGHDPLTGLSNRKVFDSRFQDAISSARSENTQVAMILLDLDRFKAVNDTLGHVIGDQFLKEVSARLLRSIRKHDTLARMGGDEFAIVMPRLRDRNEAESMAQRLLDVLRQPYHIESYELTGSASIGVSLFPEHGQDAATLQRLADVAMYQCKAQNKDEYAVFDAEANQLDFRSAQIAGLIREALENDHFRLHYQPLKAIDGTLVGFEALVRLNHPRFGTIPPDDFIPTAEHTGLIVRVGNWVLREACLQMVRWHAAGNQHLSINVNVSSVQLTKSDFAEIVKSILNETGLAPSALTLEITETGVMRNLRASLSQIEELRAMGVAIALDDFGTGYSTLDSFYSLPVDYIKIDRSFAARLTEKAEFSLDVIEAITTLAHKFGFAIVAEGIEYPEQLAAMTSIGCDFLQGYLLGRPMTAADADELLNSTGRLTRGLQMLEERLEAGRRITAIVQ